MTTASPQVRRCIAQMGGGGDVQYYLPAHGGSPKFTFEGGSWVLLTKVIGFPPPGCNRLLLFTNRSQGHALHANRHRLRAQVDAFNRRDRVDNPGGAAWYAHRSSAPDSNTGAKADRNGHHARRAGRACRPAQRHRHLSAVPDRTTTTDGACTRKLTAPRTNLTP